MEFMIFKEALQRAWEQYDDCKVRTNGNNINLYICDSIEMQFTFNNEGILIDVDNAL